jgi:hypothetical protein
MADPIYILISITISIAFLFLLGFRFALKFLKGRAQANETVKENLFFADKSFEEHLNEEMATENIRDEDENHEGRFTESEIIKLAKKYNVGQGEVELLLNLRAKEMERMKGYEKIIDEIEKGTEMRKVAKKYKVGCGEIELLMNLKNFARNNLTNKWR